MVSQPNVPAAPPQAPFVRRPHDRRPRLVGPAILITAGVVLLLVTAGVVDQAAAWRLLQFWPVLLILIGIDIVLGWLAPNALWRVVAAVAIVALAVAGSVWVVFSAPASGATTPSNFSAATGSISQPKLSLGLAGATVTIVPADLGDQLYTAHVDASSGVRPSFSLDRGSQQVNASIHNETWIGFGSVSKVELKLNNSLPWVLEIVGAGTTIKGDLSSLKIASIQISGAGTSVDTTLGAPAGIVPVDISGAGSSVRFHVPSGVSVVTDMSGLFVSASNRAASSDRSAADRFEITASGVASSLTVDQVAGG